MVVGTSPAESENPLNMGQMQMFTVSRRGDARGRDRAVHAEWVLGAG